MNQNLVETISAERWTEVAVRERVGEREYWRWNRSLDQQLEIHEMSKQDKLFKMHRENAEGNWTLVVKLRRSFSGQVH